MMQKNKRSKILLFFAFFACELIFTPILIADKQLSFSDAKSKSTYETINIKIARFANSAKWKQSTTSMLSNPSDIGWKIFFVILSTFFLLFSILTFIVNIATWKKHAIFLKVFLGCGTLFFGFLSLTTVLVIFCFLTGNSSTKTSTAQQQINDHISANAFEWQNLGAELFAESVVEADNDKLFQAIGYLEKAYTGAPNDKAITVDLADAYIEVDSPSLTAIAIELYESIFDNFSDDPLLARIAAGYYQLRNYEAAFALAEKRMECCPDKMRKAAAMQMSFIAFSSGRESAAISAILADIKRRGDVPMLKLTIAILKEGQGDKTGACEVLNAILEDKSLDPMLRLYVEKVKKKVFSE